MGLAFYFVPELQQHSWTFLPIAASSGVAAFCIHKLDIVSRSTQSYYRHDYDFADLQSEFEDLMAKYSKRSVKILFVIDEVDKVDNWNDVITPMKMLLNQGNALFYYYHNPCSLEKIQEKRSKGYTLFSQFLLLKRPLFEEMETFIDEIVHDGEKLKTIQITKTLETISAMNLAQIFLICTG